MAIVFCLLLFSAQKSFAADFSLVCKTDKIEQYINNNIKMYGQPADAATSGTYSNQLNWPTIDGWQSVSVINTNNGCQMFYHLDGFSQKPIWWDEAYRTPEPVELKNKWENVDGVSLAKARIHLAWDRLSKEIDAKNCDTHENYLNLAEYCYVDAIPNPPYRFWMGDVTMRYRRELRREMPLKLCREPSAGFMIMSLSDEQEKQRRIQLCGRPD